MHHESIEYIRSLDDRTLADIAGERGLRGQLAKQEQVRRAGRPALYMGIAGVVLSFISILTQIMFYNGS